MLGVVVLSCGSRTSSGHRLRKGIRKTDRWTRPGVSRMRVCSSASGRFRKNHTGRRGCSEPVAPRRQIQDPPKPSTREVFRDLQKSVPYSPLLAPPPVDKKSVPCSPCSERVAGRQTSVPYSLIDKRVSLTPAARLSAAAPRFCRPGKRVSPTRAPTRPGKTVSPTRASSPNSLPTRLEGRGHRLAQLISQARLSATNAC